MVEEDISPKRERARGAHGERAPAPSERENRTHDKTTMLSVLHLVDEGERTKLVMTGRLIMVTLNIGKR